MTVRTHGITGAAHSCPPPPGLAPPLISQHTHLLLFFSCSSFPVQIGSSRSTCPTSLADCPLRHGGSQGKTMLLMWTSQTAEEREKCAPTGEWVTGLGGAKRECVVPVVLGVQTSTNSLIKVLSSIFPFVFIHPQIFHILCQLSTFASHQAEIEGFFSIILIPTSVNIGIFHLQYYLFHFQHDSCCYTATNNCGIWVPAVWQSFHSYTEACHFLTCTWALFPLYLGFWLIRKKN